MVLETALNQLADTTSAAVIIDDGIAHIPTEFHHEVCVGRTLIAKYLRPFRFYRFL